MKRFSFYNSFILSSILFVLPLISAGCGDDDGVITGQELVPVTASNSNLLSGQSYTFPNGASINPALTGQATTLTFNSVSGTSGNFSLGAGGNTATGNITIGSCIFTVTNSSIPGLAVGTVITFNPCNLRISFSDIVVGGSEQVGDVVFEAVNQTSGQSVQSNPSQQNVRLGVDGTLLLEDGSGNFVDTGVELRFTGTGSVTG